MGEESDDLKRRGGLLEDGALLMPIMRKKRDVPAGSIYWSTSRVFSVLQAGLGVSGRVYLCLLFRGGIF